MTTCPATMTCTGQSTQWTDHNGPTKCAPHVTCNWVYPNMSIPTMTGGLPEAHQNGRPPLSPVKVYTGAVMPKITGGLSPIGQGKVYTSAGIPRTAGELSPIGQEKVHSNSKISAKTGEPPEVDSTASNSIHGATILSANSADNTKAAEPSQEGDKLSTNNTTIISPNLVFIGWALLCTVCILLSQFGGCLGV